MPLIPYKRGAAWWAKGRVEYAGAPITPYLRCSTGTSSESAARDWCREEEERRLRRFLLGDERARPPLTFAGAVLLYPANAKTAAYLLPIVDEIGDTPVRDITPKQVRELGPRLYPDAGTKTWTRQVVSPVRAVINNAHDLGECPPIRIRQYSREEQVRQDEARGSTGRVKYPPGSWEWLLKFRAHASERCAALALTMFVTGARIGQAVAMHPGKHLDLQNCRICIPAAKGQPGRWLDIPPELVADLANLPVLYPRGWERKPENLRVFGYAGRSGPLKEWNKACKAAKIDFLPFHAAGRHGFGQEMNVRQPIDEKAAGEFGGWSDTSLMRRTYTHPEDTGAKVKKALGRGLKQAERKTGIKLKRTVG